MSESAEDGFIATPLRKVSARLVAYDWAWARSNASQIQANWKRRRAEKPALFDGIVLLACSCMIENGTCKILFFETRYSSFIAFRDAGSPDSGVFNAFSAIVPCAVDGAMLLGEMGAHTANGGQIYFACGTPDREDIRHDGSVDLTESAIRECREETGLDPTGAEDLGWTLMQGDGQLVFLRMVRFAESTETLIQRIEAHWATQAEPELTRMVVARSSQDINAARMPGFVRAYLAEAFAR